MLDGLDLRVASLFSGCGGSDLGIEGGFEFNGNFYPSNHSRVVYANDFDTPACSTYRLNFSNGIQDEDITKISSDDVPAHDILVGGFPCQTFSIVGRRHGLKDPRGQLFYEMVRLLKDKRPKAFIAENVKGLLNIDKGETFRLILEEFGKAGYAVTYKLLNAANYGVPQKRERVFIIGIRNDLGKQFVFPAQTHFQDPAPGQKGWIPLASIIDNIIPENPKYIFSDRAHEGLKKSNKAFNKGRAQDLSQPCNTVSSHLAKVSLNGTDPVLFMPELKRYRRFTPLEAARIQSFPDHFKFAGTDANAYKQIGNAVPPVLMWHVYDQLVRTLLRNPEPEAKAASKQLELAAAK